MVGVVALQGGYEAHARVLRRLGHEVAYVREASDLEGLIGLVLPGGESSTQLKLLARFGLEGPLDDFVRAGNPVLCTCAGLILASKAVRGPEQPSYGWLDVEVARNAWGRQVHSFEARSDQGHAMIFIRAPRIERVGAGVEVLATFEGEPVMVRQGAVTGVAFHPELAPDDAVHAAVFGRP